jgi:hypothetical protein
VSDELPWGTAGFAVALSPTALVPVYVTLIERGPRAPLIDMRKSGISPESREAIRTGVLAALVNYKKLFTALARVHKYRLTMHEGLWHLLAGYHFHVDIRGVDVEGNSLGFTVALATVSLLLGVPLLPHTGTTGAVRPSVFSIWYRPCTSLEVHHARFDPNFAFTPVPCRWQCRGLFWAWPTW